MLLLFSGSSGSPSAPSGACGYSTLKITDGTTTADLTDQTNYQLVDNGWAPSVAPLRKSTLGGSGPYEDCVEQIVVNVHGATAATCLANLAKLSQLLDQAERWSRGETVSAVRLQCQPWGSSLSAPLECVILGRVQDKFLSLPATFNDKLEIGIYEVPYVRVSFVRRGQWLAAEETVGPSVAADNATVQTATFTSSAAIMSPAKVLVTGLNLIKNASYLLIASATDRLAVIDAEGFATTTSPWSVVADSANNARGGSVLRYTPAGTTTVRNSLYLSSLAAGIQRVGVFVALRNNSATVTWRIRLSGDVDGSHEVQAPEQYIDASSQNPRILYLGDLTFEGTLTHINLDFTASSIGGSPTIDLDYVALLVMDDDTSSVVAFLPVTGTNGGGVIVDARALTKPSPIASGLDGISLPISYAGDAWARTKGLVLAAALLMTGGNAATSWRCITALGVVSQTQLTVTRRLAYLTPQ